MSCPGLPPRVTRAERLTQVSGGHVRLPAGPRYPNTRGWFISNITCSSPYGERISDACAMNERGVEAFVLFTARTKHRRAIAAAPASRSAGGNDSTVPLKPGASKCSNASAMMLISTAARHSSSSGNSGIRDVGYMLVMMTMLLVCTTH